jgi:hypothetical protein
LDRRYIRSLKMVSSPSEKVTELAIATKKNTMQQEAARLDRSRYVGTSQTRLHHVPNQNFKPAAPTSGDKIINKRRFSPLVACGRSLAGVKTDVGPFNRRQHMEMLESGSGQMCIITTWNRGFGACNIGCGVGSPQIDKR